MWWHPDHSAFDEEDLGMLTGIGKLNLTYLERIKGFAATAMERSKRENFQKTPLVRLLSITLRDLLYRLEHVSSNFRTMQLGVRGTQRVFLELTALLDFVEIYNPVLLGKSPPETIPNVARIMGTFTTDLSVCHRRHSAKIPVWLVRPFSALHSRVFGLLRLHLCSSLRARLRLILRSDHPTL